MRIKELLIKPRTELQSMMKEGRMNRRQIIFLSELADKNDYAPLNEFAQKMKVSEKTLRRDILEIDNYLKASGKRIEKKSGVGIKLSLSREEKEKLANNLALMSFLDRNKQRVLKEKNSRKTDIALNLLLYSDEYTSLSELSYKYYASKSSIVQDLRAVEKLFEKYSLSLVKNAKGTKVNGGEADIRNALTELISYIFDQRINRAAQDKDINMVENFIPETLSTILYIFKEKDINFVEKALRDIETRENYSFDDLEFMGLSLFLLIGIWRTENGYFIKGKEKNGISGKKNPEKPAERRMGEIAESLIKKIEEEYSSKLPREEAENIYRKFLSTGLFAMKALNGCDGSGKAEGRDEEDKEKLFSEDFIDAFSTITGINLRAKPEFYKNIRSHISLMLNRAVNNNPAVNPILEMIGNDYQGTLNVCRVICGILTEKLGLPRITSDEICFLMFYIQGEIIGKEEEAKVLLISDVNRSITGLIKKRLFQRFPGWAVTDTDINGLKTIKKGNYDFALSTVPDENIAKEMPYVFISPVLDNNDFKNIQELFWRVRTDADIFLRELIRTAHDLNDIGCTVRPVIKRGEENEKGLPNGGERESVIKGKWVLSVKALKNIEYVYSVSEKSNECIIEIDGASYGIERIAINMENRDFMLFATKLLYLTDNCPTEVIEGFSRYLIAEGGGNV